MLSHTACGEGILAVGRVDALSVDIDGGLLGGVYRGHYDVGVESFSWIEGCLFWNDKG